MEIKTKGNENEIILGDFNFTINKLDRDGGNKWQRIYRFRFNYVLSKLIEKNELEDLRRKENPDSSEFTIYDRISGTRSRIDGVCSDHYNTISIDRLSSKTKIGKDSWYFNNSFLWKPEFSSATMNLLFYGKHTKKTTLQRVTGGNTPNFVLKRMQRIFLKISPLKKILEFQDWKKTTKLIQKRKF